MRRLVVVVACALALAGCGGDPKADPSPTPSSPSSSSTTPAPPVMPEAAKANTKAGAVAFVRYYVELVNHAQATGDVDSLAAVEDPDCTSCNQARDTLKAIYGSGGQVRGGALQAKIRQSAPRPDVKGWTIFADVSYGQQEVDRPTGTETLSGGHSVLTFVVKHEGSQWSVLRWSRGS